MRSVLTGILFLIYRDFVTSHSRLGFPLPDDYTASGSTNAALTTANCGHSPNEVWGSGTGGITDFAPGFATIRIQEIASFNGPFRLCLLDSNEVCRYVLLDHIPQNSGGSMTYHVTVWLPDVNCDGTTKCKIQQIWMLTGGTECKYYDRDTAIESTLPTNVSPQACSSFYHSCASVRISGTKSLNSIAPLTVATKVTSGTYYLPVDGQPSTTNGGVNWPYGTTADYTMNHYSVAGRPLESTLWNVNGFLPSVLKTDLGKDYSNGKTFSASTLSPTVSNAPSLSITSIPTVNGNAVPSAPPVEYESSSSSSNNNNIDSAGSVAGIVIGILVLLLVLISICCFRERMKDYFFGPKQLRQNLIDIKSGRYELGSIDQDNDPLAWTEMVATDGRTYWYNMDTCASTFKRPTCLLKQPNNTNNYNSSARNQERGSAKSSDWTTHYNDEGVAYYWNAKTGISTYERPF